MSTSTLRVEAYRLEADIVAPRDGGRGGEEDADPQYIHARVAGNLSRIDYTFKIPIVTCESGKSSILECPSCTTINVC
jgi:hypothetical protein